MTTLSWLHFQLAAYIPLPLQRRKDPSMVSVFFAASSVRLFRSINHSMFSQSKILYFSVDGTWFSTTRPSYDSDAITHASDALQASE